MNLEWQREGKFVSTVIKKLYLYMKTPYIFHILLYEILYEFIIFLCENKITWVFKFD
jgi:hypothetical protein